MKNKDTRSPQSLPWLRLLGGGYLVYLAWDLRTAVQDGPVFLIAVAVFALTGAAVLGHSLIALTRSGLFRNDANLLCDGESDPEAGSND